MGYSGEAEGGLNIAAKFKWIVLATVLLGFLAIFAVVQPEKLDADLCPESAMRNASTILLVDTSDPLTAKHRSELSRLMEELRTPPVADAVARFYVEPGEELTVYEIQDDLEAIKPVVRVCNPGNNPMEWQWYDDLTRGKSFAIKNWRQFENAITGLFAKQETAEQAQSLILENIAVILPHHTRSSFQTDLDSKPTTHLIIFSDLLQNSQILSHYAPYPSAKYPTTDNFTSKATLRELATDMTGVHVSLLRLERSQYAAYQTDAHYRWWTNFIVKTGGFLQYQRSI